MLIAILTHHINANSGCPSSKSGLPKAAVGPSGPSKVSGAWLLEPCKFSPCPPAHSRAAQALPSRVSPRLRCFSRWQMIFPALVFLGLKNNDCCGCCGNEGCGKRFAVSDRKAAASAPPGVTPGCTVSLCWALRGQRRVTRPQAATSSGGSWGIGRYGCLAGAK